MMQSRNESAWRSDVPNRRWFALPVFICCLVAGCSRGLTREAAKNVIEHNEQIRSSDRVSVDGISSTSPTEAVVRATIAGATTNLKFRRFDTGWVWEFVETKAGGWISPDVAIGQLREEQRNVAATAWANENRDSYAKTARTMYLVSVYHVPNPAQRERYTEFLKLKKMLLGLGTGRAGSEEAQAVLATDSWRDAWGSDIQFAASHKDSSILLSSRGPDKVSGTNDDVTCLNVFTRGYEDGRQVWHRGRHWTVPEKLGDVLEDFDQESDKLEYSKVVQP